MRKNPLTAGDLCIAVLFGATIVIVAAQVVFRYLLNNSLSWSEELSRYLFTWIIFLGAALAIRDNTHIRIELSLDRLAPKGAKYLRFFSCGLLVAFLVFLVISGFKLVKVTENTLSPALSLPLSYVYYAALPVSAFLGILYAVRRILTLSGEKKAKGDFR